MGACVKEIADFEEILEETLEEVVLVKLIVKFEENGQLREEVGRRRLILEFKQD